MTSYNLDNIARDVRVAMDHNMVSDPLSQIGDVDTLALDEIIKSKVCEAVKRIHSAAPVHHIDESMDMNAEMPGLHPNITPQDKTGVESKYMHIPDDFMRLVRFKISDWERSVYGFIAADDPRASLQSSRFRGIRGTKQKPVCVLDTSSESRVIRIYPCGEGVHIETAIYLPYPKVENGSINICPRCYDAVVYTTVALVLTALGETDKVPVFTDLAKTSLI